METTSVQDRLLEAVRACDLEAIRACAQAGADLSGPVGGRTPPLHCAAMQPSRAAAIPMLIELGADINGYDAEGVTAVSIAAFSGNVPAIRLLASGGADVNAVDGRGSHPLHRAVSTNRIDVVEALAAAGADVNARAGIFSGLYLACLRNNVPMVRLLIRLGADCNGSNSFKNLRIVLSPLSVVGIDLLEAMVEAGLDLTTRVVDGPPLHYAAEHGNQAARGRTALQLAADDRIRRLITAEMNYERRRSFLCFLAGSGFLGAAPTSGVFPTATMAMRVLGMRDMRREIMSFV